MLYIIATPIGNLQDITLRAIEILKTVDVIAAEDTRHSRTLLDHFGIKTPLLALHDHNERDKSGEILQRIKAGESVALISDAGTPLINDPGYHLVKQAHALDIKVVPIPGASALITALSAAGLPTDRFSFEGFLESKATARREQLTALQTETRTLVFYETPHRILDAINDMKDIFGADREVCIARELTKNFETINTDTLENLLSWLKADANQQKGEFVVVVHGAGSAIKEQDISIEVQRVVTILLADLPLKQAVQLASEITGVKKNLLYTWALENKTNG